MGALSLATVSSPQYVELRTRSAFSFLEGGSNPEDLILTAAALNIPAVAIVDRDGFYGAPRFHMAAVKAGITAHIGAEVTCTNGKRAPLLCESRQGYQNLCQLLTLMKLRVPKNDPKRHAAATWDELAAHRQGLICLDPSFYDIYGPRQTYVELQRHFDARQEAANRARIDFARRHDLPLVATNGVCYATPADRQITDALMCLRHYTTLDEAGRLLHRNSERHLKSAAEMTALFADLPEAIYNTVELSHRLAFTLKDLGYEFPRYPVPGVPFPPTQRDLSQYLRQVTDEGARRRYIPYHDKAREQVERELALIEKLELAGYFLIVWDLVEFCRRNNILAQGRGSAANSAVCYSLGITAVDPVGMELLFERFLSEERGEWPDIDIDLPSGDQRERVIQYVYDRYGAHGAAMTANVITYRGRSAAREMGKVLGFDEEVCARLSATAPMWGWKEPTDCVEERFRKAGFDLTDHRYLQFAHLYSAAQDLPRHLGQHSGGMVICQNALSRVVPLEPASMPNRVVLQWDKEDCADLGLIKVDLLGLGMMAVLEDCIAISRDTYKEEIDLAHLPPDDPNVYAALQSADTIGMFQVESRAQMSSLPRVRPEKFYDVVVQVALIRPGPIVGKMVHPYLRRRQGRETAECLHPWLEPVLRRTLGVPLFQEQLLRMAMIVANFTGGEAEELRRAMGFKRSEKRMKEIEKKLRAGMTANGIVGETQETIVHSIVSFALYGFPESHAASFALLAYASAWLKVNYPAVFTAALLNNQPMGFYHPATIVKDAQRHGVRVLPVDVTLSDWLCTVLPDKEKPTFRLGLNYVRSLREASAKAIVGRRPFSSVDDMCRRCPELNKDEVRRLAEIGALNALEAGLHRRGAQWEVERTIRSAGPLFAEPSAAGESPLPLMNAVERLTADFAGTGITIGRHPMCYHRPNLPNDILRAADLEHVPQNRYVKVAGIVIVRQRPGTARGFVFLSLEDETGISNIILEPDFFEENRATILQNSCMVFEGIMQNQDNVRSVKARRVTALPAIAAAPAHNFH
ncbi:MAG: error-prone DNA polymerase [Bryobacterales bacterium]|nr:error-prone DNA polymerase [Bryobacterales bacterium]